MLQRTTSPTPNAIDGGDTLPIRPSRRPNDSAALYDGDVRRNAERLLLLTEQTASFRGREALTRTHETMEDIDLTQSSRASSIHDAEDRTDEDIDLEQHQKPRHQISVKDAETYATQILFGSKRNMRPVTRRDLSPETAEQSHVSFIEGDGFVADRSIERQNLEKQGRRRIILLGIIALLIAVMVATVAFTTQRSQIEQEEPTTLTPEDQSTTAPNPSPSTDNNRTFDSIATFLGTFTTVDDHNFQDTTKPQYQAISWMANIDTFAYSIPESSKDDGYFDFIQRYALAVLFYTTNGDHWDDSSYYLQPTHACTWNYEILLTKDEMMKVGVTCNGRKEVTALIMPNNKMNGALPEEMKFLTALHLIDFSHNTIQGSIPSQFTQLGHLQFFDLRHNELTGSIPAWIGSSFQNLRELGLSFNQMTGTLPSSMSQMEKLKTLALAHNDFESSLAPIMHLPELEYLYLENNRFKDTVDDQFLIDSTSLVQLDLSSNLLTGQGLPHHFFAYPNLKVLDLSDNQINGTIQDVHIRKHPLEFLSLSNNSLTGTLPTTIAYLRSLRHLDLTGNHLSGDIPSTLGNMQSLNYLFLSENDWTPGQIPMFLSEMSNLRELGLRATNRRGSLSSQWFERLQLLDLFDISDNKMTGSIPSLLLANPHLHYVLLNRNEFDGELSNKDISSNLQLLLLDKNKVTGNLTGLCIGSNITIVADCVEDEIICDCCHCCADSDAMCNNYVWYMNEEFSWENNYKRTGYEISPALLMPKTKGRHSQGIQENHV